ncbi:MAG: hypothetical protein IKQ37_03970 [Bacteroidaceae bacterium]|nr:hypothetical protein [Bacteroidaceae bacterium]
MEHLALEIFNRDGNGSKYAFLPSDTSITIIDTSEIFDSGDIWSYSFKLNIHANSHIFGSAGEMHGSRLHEQVDKRRARLWVEGLPLYYGYLRLDDEVDVDEDGDVNVSFESGQKTFYDMIEGAKANQVPLMGDVLIGMAAERERTFGRHGVQIKLGHFTYGLFGDKTYHEGIVWADLQEKDGIKAQMFPKYVRPDGTWKKYGTNEEFTILPENTINTDYAYDESHPYCNVTICYQDKEWKDNGTEIEEKTIRGYHVSSPRRINPAPNFFVLYWLDCLMKHLGIYIKENQMLGVKDLRRLFFVNTKCSYKTKGTIKYTGDYMPLGPNSPLVPQPTDEDPAWSITLEPQFDEGFWGALNYSYCEMVHVGWGGDTVLWQPAYATSANFPETDISDVIESIESGFCARLLFNKDYTDVRIVLLREVFRSNDVSEISCEITEISKKENNILGFRLTYGGSEEDTAYNYKGFVSAKKIEKNKWEDEPDAHDYTKFAFYDNYVPIKEKAKTLSPTCYVAKNTGNSYVVKIDENAKNPDEWYPSQFECAEFIDAEDGDCGGEEETIKEVHIGFTPAIMSAISGASGRSQNFNSPTYLLSLPGMQYAIFISEEMGVPYKETGAYAQLMGTTDSYNRAIDTTPSEILNKMAGSAEPDSMGCTFTQKRPEYQSGLFEVATSVPFVAKNSMGGDTFTISGQVAGVSPAQYWSYTYKITGWIREGYRLYLDDNYKVSDELLSPLEKVDWGLTLGVLRGSFGSLEAGRTVYDADDIEGEGNDYWGTLPGDTASAHPDICDDYGILWRRCAMRSYTGLEYGDKLLSEAGFANQCDLKSRKGPVPTGLDTLSLIDTYYSSHGYDILILTDQGYYATIGSVTDTGGTTHVIWLCCVYEHVLKSYGSMLGQNGYLDYLQHGTNNTSPSDINEILRRDRNGNGTISNMIIAIDPTVTSEFLKTVCDNYIRGNAIVNYGYVDSSDENDGRVSLKLRAEKPNPYFDPTQPESAENQRFLEISNPTLRQRGLADQFYKEYSYWVRNARIAKMKVKMELAQFLNIDKTKRVRIGDITGFIKKMQYSIDMSSGLGLVNMEVWYL